MNRIITDKQKQGGNQARGSRNLPKCVDFIAGYGGEEFVALLANMDLRHAKVKLAELLGKIAGSTCG